MNLTIDELRNSGFAELINQLRKHQDSQISSEAKSIRNHLKQVYYFIYIISNFYFNSFNSFINSLYNQQHQQHQL